MTALDPERLDYFVNISEKYQSKAKQAQQALERLRAQIGPQDWLNKAIVACDALNWGCELKQNGCPKGKTWKDMGLE